MTSTSNCSPLQLIAVLVIASSIAEFRAQLVADNTTIYSKTSKYELTSLNVGYGVVVIGIGIAISVIICILGRGTRNPEVVALLAGLIPIILLIIFRYSPKEADRSRVEQDEFATDGYFIPRIISLVIFILTFLITMFFLFKLHIAQPHEGRRIAGVSYGDDEKKFRNEENAIDENNKKDEPGEDKQDGASKIKVFTPQQNVSNVSGQNPSMIGVGGIQGQAQSNKLIQRGKGKNLPPLNEIPHQENEEKKNLIMK